MSEEVSISLGGKWAATSAELSQQSQLIAHLSNELQGLRVSAERDLQQVEKQKEIIRHLEEELRQMEIDRDQWKSAYTGIVDKRVVRDQVVDEMNVQLRSLEDTTRKEEIRANEAEKKCKLLQKEKDIIMEKYNTLHTELDETYSSLAAANEKLASHGDEIQTLTNQIQTLQKSRDTKENQVLTLLKEKNRLFRLVTDLRSTIKVAGGASITRPASAKKPSGGKLNHSLSIHDIEDGVKHDVEEVRAAVKRGVRYSSPSPARVHGAGNIVDKTLSGLIDRPAWTSANPDIREKLSVVKKDITSEEKMAEMSFNSSVSNLFFGASGTSVHSSPSQSHSSSTTSLHAGRSGRPSPAAEKAVYGEEEKHNRGEIGDNEKERKAAIAKKNLLLRLRHHIDLLEEKNSELEKSLVMTRNENSLLMVRFRGAHERRVQAERRVKELEKEYQKLCSGDSAPSASVSASSSSTSSRAPRSSPHHQHGNLFQSHMGPDEFPVLREYAAYIEQIPPPPAGRNRPASAQGGTRWR